MKNSRATASEIFKAVAFLMCEILSKISHLIFRNRTGKHIR
ncbi:hypothetical protein TREVI0001_0390 [Treponema vincentii ATCC 35580]|uniref:Uncharacterized protein n=1 Tax=Treponema vincentii ATCC 35580 TaxID=596324 RepID=C8PTH3_9SPIR|nr:hypothetical protein TREVI0001_0390 [Treponema vincentii ATCC 35580]